VISAEIFDLKGQIIRSVSDVKQVDISELNEGLYIIFARDANGSIYSTKLLKTSY
ncbi:MAG: hypothetical protein C0591_11620, partial [Marinilabiliales bacterium]